LGLDLVEVGEEVVRGRSIGSSQTLSDGTERNDDKEEI
jgi:hypothetical protein